MSDNLYNMHELIRTVGRIEGKLDAALEELNSVHERQHITETRLDWARGGLAALGAVFALVSFPGLAEAVSKIIK